MEYFSIISYFILINFVKNKDLRQILFLFPIYVLFFTLLIIG